MKKMYLKIVFIFLILFTYVGAQERHQNGSITNINKKTELKEIFSKPELIKAVEFSNCSPTSEGLLFQAGKSDKFFISSKEKIDLENPEPFIAFSINVRYLNLQNGQFQLSFSTSLDGNAFSDWEILNEEEHRDNVSGFYQTQLQFLDKNTKYFRLKIVAGPKTSVNVISYESIAISPGASKNLGTINNKKEKSLQPREEFPKPVVVSRTEWECPDGQGSSWSPSYTVVTHLIVHHSAGVNSSSDWAAVVRSIWSYHTINNQWGDVGYNYLIDPNGVIYEGRSGGDNVIGAHFCSFNSNTMGTCLMGTFTSVMPQPATMSALRDLLAWKAFQRSIDVLGNSTHSGSGYFIPNISGHREGCLTECPGQLVYNFLPTFRQDLKSFLANLPPRVVTTDPIEGYQNFKAYKPVIITFSSGMNQSSVEGAVNITPPIAVAYNWLSPKVLALSPDIRWSFSTSYTIEIDSSAKNIYGAKLHSNGTAGGNFTLNFSVMPVDNNPPQIEKGYPIGNNTSVLAEFKFVFDEPIANLGGRVKLLDSDFNNVAYTSALLTIKNDKSLVTFKPVNNLINGSVYHVNFLKGITDYFGNATTSDYTFSFMTETVSPQQGAILDNFESISAWLQPQESAETINIDSSQTNFELTSERKISSHNSGKLNYRFSGLTAGNLVVPIKTGINLTDAINIGIWMFGDLSGNKLFFKFGANGISEYPIAIIDWYGWKYCSIAMSNVPASDRIFKGLKIEQVSNADTSGYVFFDDLQYNAILSIEDSPAGLPKVFTVYPSYPNPFNPETKILFFLPESDKVVLTIYNSLGQVVKTLIEECLISGVHSVNFNAESFASGIYFARVQAGSKIQTIKLLYLK